MTSPNSDQVYDILVEECGAHDGDMERMSFQANFHDFDEWRFMGNLGFGGKIWRYAIYGNPHRTFTFKVTCYPEDKTPELQTIIDRANARLEDLFK